ncbi:leucyl aminopeptidase [Cohnella cholangitidis]|uniref:Probable cytosol aminopeptidase n=1 Tax=Cohnella cholangitidis TaxID=2598458 RepID=A0A7G5C2K4_9BACL|nr:leucyl aminopeptidase [Cohnella cholangitidis]QMV43438.1 leucyl aminopeptidase [Cohnella cholangitidis]
MLWTDWSLKWTTKGPSSRGSQGSAEIVIALAGHRAVNEDGLILHPTLDQALRERAQRGIYHGKTGESLLLSTFGLLSESYALYVGCDQVPYTSKALREAAGSVGKTLLEYRIRKAVFVLPAEFVESLAEPDVRAASQALMEGLLLGLYRRNSRSKQGRELADLSEIEFVLESEQRTDEWNAGLQLGYETANAACYARELTNEPANLLTPERLADEARSLARKYGLECLIYDENDAAQEGMGGLLAVGQGSVNPPRMIVIRHRGNPESSETLGLIGKGVTFDTGGISIKKAAGMEEMISDMGGAAAIMGAMRAIGERKPALNVVAVIPAAENMPSGNAYKPGDVLTTYSGKTVEVLNTDAEGRIVLADGLATALRQGATKLIDVATLTGAVMHALGDLTTGAFTNDEAMLESFLKSARRAGEYVWPLPTYPEYQRLLKSDVADVKNHGGSWAGAIAGALFVNAFSEARPWIHLDIGGTAWMWSDRGFESKGGTGVMVRSLLEYIWSETNSQN